MSDLLIDLPSEIMEAMGQIEDKLYERGMIVSLCGDAEAEISLLFSRREHEGIYLQLKVFARADAHMRVDAAERVSDFVAAKIYDVFDGRNFDFQNDFIGVEVFLNNILVY